MTEAQSLGKRTYDLAFGVCNTVASTSMGNTVQGLFSWGVETAQSVVSLIKGATNDQPSASTATHRKKRKVSRPKAFKPHETEEQRTARRARRAERARSQSQGQASSDEPLQLPSPPIMQTAGSIASQPASSRSAARQPLAKTQSRLGQTLKQRLETRAQLTGARQQNVALTGSAKASPLHRGLHTATQPFRPSAGLDRRTLSDADRILRQVTPHKKQIRKPVYPASDTFRSRPPIFQSPAQASPAVPYRSPGQELPRAGEGHNMFKTKNGSNRMPHGPVSVDDLVAQLKKEYGDGYEWTRITKEKAERDARIAERRLRESGAVVRDPLPEKTVAQVKGYMRGRVDPDKVLAKDFNLDVTVKDIRTLTPGQWLNDQVINYWMQLLNERSKTSKGKLPKVHCFNTFFYSSLSKSGYGGVKRWAKKAKVDIAACDLVIFPVHLSVHWCLAAINKRRKRFEYWDSLGGWNAQVFDKMREYYRGEVPAFEQEKDEWHDFFAAEDYHPGDAGGSARLSTNGHANGHVNGNKKDKRRSEAPMQANGYDCGMFACRTAECVARQVDPDFSQADIDDMRLRLAASIIDGRIY